MTLVEAKEAAASDKWLHSDLSLLRLFLWISVVGYAGLGLVGFAGFAGFWPPPGPDLSETEIHAYFRDNATGIKVGMIMMAMCGPWYYVWSMIVSKVLSQMEGPMGILSNAQRTGGMLTGIVTFTPAVIWFTAVYRDTRSPEMVQMLYDFGWFFFDLTFVCSFIQQVAFGIAVLRDDRATPLIPKWCGWIAILSSITFLELAIMPYFKEGPFAWNDVLGFWAVFASFFIFIAVVTPTTWKALHRLEDEMSTPAEPLRT